MKYKERSGALYLMRKKDDITTNKRIKTLAKIGICYADMSDSVAVIRKKFDKRIYEHDRRSSFKYYIHACMNRPVCDANILERTLHELLSEFRFRDSGGKEFFELSGVQCDRIGQIFNLVERERI